MHCPYNQGTVVSTLDGVALVQPGSLLTPPASHPNGILQTESLRRIARERTRQKRGPPAFLAL
jgi:hypothetical protein